MSVGIMDADISTYLLVPFNLEVMKMSAYYKQQGEIVVLTQDFNPEKHSKFIYWKDYEDGIYPLNLISSGATYGGLAFSNNKYKPLDMKIERMKPDTSIYYKLKNSIEAGRAGKKIYQNLSTAEHCRLSLDGESIWTDYKVQFRDLKNTHNIIFHDYDLNSIKGSFEEIQKILRQAKNYGYNIRIGMKFPVQVYNGDDLLKWSTLKTNSTFYSLRYNGIIDNDSFIKWIGEQREHAVFTQTEYYITSLNYSEEYVLSKLRDLFHQILISRSYRINLLLKYDEGFFKNPKWEEVIRLFNYFASSYKHLQTSMTLLLVDDDTLYNFAKNSQETRPRYHLGEYFTKSKIREIFRFVRENDYSLFKDFYECSAKTLGGRL